MDLDSPLIQKISSHLEFLGYELTRREKSIRAVHAKKMNMNYRPFNGGVLISAYYGTSGLAKRDREGYFLFINKINEKASVARCYNDSDDDFCLEAWYPGNYDKGRFGTFMDLWERDTLHRLGELSEASDYLE